MAEYDLKSLNLPKLWGTQLKAFTAAIENPAVRPLLLGSLLDAGGIPKFRKLEPNEPPTYLPLVKPDTPGLGEPFLLTSGNTPQDFPYRTASGYYEAYRRGDITPTQVAERVLACIEASEQGAAPLRAFIAVRREDVLAQARASEVRWQSGRPLGPLDGIPVAVKDEVDMLPFPTTVGTSFMGKAPALRDSTVVDRLRAAGALMVGKTNMHEIGIAPNGFNAHHGTVRNPQHEDCDPGGSSSGSGAAVAAGIVPIAVGADGGGSIRIPASLCGVVGLKPTFGRVSEAGAAQLCWSVAHLGPIADCVEDTALAYAVMAGPDLLDPNTLIQPPLSLAGWNRPDLQGVRLGIYPAWFEHADSQVVQICKAMVENLRLAGAEICEIEVPGLDEMRVAHVITILSEMAVCMKNYRLQRKQHSLEVRINLVLGDSLTAVDYLLAQRVRTRAMAAFHQIYSQVDAILTPTTALAAQLVMPGGRVSGWSDLGTDTEMMRYVVAGNLVGLPAISFPVGYDNRGLPVGMQAMGRHWEENLLLRIAYTSEQALERRKPRRFYSPF